MSTLVTHDLQSGKTVSRPLTAAEILSAQAARPVTSIERVKMEAQRRILSRYSLAAQSNMNMRASELNDIRFERALTPEEEAERQALKSTAAWIKSVRATSDAIEARLASDPFLDPASQPDWPA